MSIFKQFSAGLTWNALLYTLYKASTTLFSVVLFMRLTTYDYATWANINALVFLAILWLDLGLRKSIPRFCPEFARNRTTHTYFIRLIITTQCILLMTATPLFIVAAENSAYALSLDNNLILFYAATLLFLSEGFIALLRTLYHAHFWNKEFNSLTIIMLIIEMALNVIILIAYSSSSQILTSILAVKIITGIITIIACLCMLSRMYAMQQYIDQDHATIDTKSLTKSFIKHSTIMWFNTNIKSVSERNFLVPFITYWLGHTHANIFKLASDGALLLHRMVIKTIGLNDTALLAHIHALHGKELMDNAFKKLTTKIAALCLPLLGIIIIGGTHSAHLLKNNNVFLIFFIITLGYLLETMLSPYERLLEVNAHYRYLIYAYTPYIIIIIILYLFNCITFIGLVNMILIIQGVRLVSSLIMVYYAYKAHAISLSMYEIIRYDMPRAILRAMVIALPVYIGGYLIIKYTWVGEYALTWVSQ